MTEARMKQMIATACQENVEHLAKRFEEKLQDLADTFEGSIVGNGRPTRQPRARVNTPRTQETFLIRTNPRGELSRLPNDFQFPKGGMYDCWVQWNVGHIKHSIPPLSSLTPREFQFVDDMAKTDSEQRCQRGPRKFK
jgi:hypothetical protein